LISMWMTNNGIADIANSNILRLDFIYDYLGKRVSKTVSQWVASSNAYQPFKTNNFVYDGWNLVAVADSEFSVSKSFVWGKDISLYSQNAAGIGGLLMISIPGTNCFPTYDGSGNIDGLINASDETMLARYEYSPFGQLIRITGSLAGQNPFRFSSKFLDEESGLIYFRSRYYDPQLGRWTSRDQGNDPRSMNQLQFVLNNPNTFIDPDGNSVLDPRMTFYAIITAAKLFVSGGEEDVDRAEEVLDQMVQHNEWKEKVAELEEEAERVRISGGGNNETYMNHGARRPFDRARNKILKGTLSVLAIGAMIVTAEHVAEAAAIDHVARNDSSYVSQMYKDLDNNDQGFADLDAALGALEVSGDTAEGALVTVGVFYDAQDVYSSPDSSHQNPNDDVSEMTYDTITIKQ
jgi:RHS repeat-associated protein